MDEIQLSAFALLSHLFFPQPNWPNWAVLICTVREHSLLWGSAGIKRKNNTGAMFFLSSAWCVLCLVARSCPTLCEPVNCSPPGSSVHGDSPGKNTAVGCQCPPPGDLPNPGTEPRSPALQEDSLPSQPPGKPTWYKEGYFLEPATRQEVLLVEKAWVPRVHFRMASRCLTHFFVKGKTEKSSCLTWFAFVLLQVKDC